MKGVKGSQGGANYNAFDHDLVRAKTELVSRKDFYEVALQDVQKADKLVYSLTDFVKTGAGLLGTLILAGVGVRQLRDGDWEGSMASFGGVGGVAGVATLGFASRKTKARERANEKARVSIITEYGKEKAMHILGTAAVIGESYSGVWKRLAERKVAKLVADIDTIECIHTSQMRAGEYLENLDEDSGGDGSV